MTLKEEILLKMHEFYVNESRHQRSMMWETVKWFTPILTLLLGGFGKIVVDHYNTMDLRIGIVLFLLAIFGILLCNIAIGLLKMFYKTNLKYVTMFIKCEDELDFDKAVRTKRDFFKSDDNITYWNYVKNRARCSSEQFVDDMVKMKWGTLVGRMRSVFWLHELFFAIGAVCVVILLYRS